MTQTEIEHIIQTGKLSGYSISSGFIQVQWTTPELEQGEFWLFKFTSANNKLVSVDRIRTRYYYTKHQARKYVPMIKDLMKSIIE